MGFPRPCPLRQLWLADWSERCFADLGLEVERVRLWAALAGAPLTDARS